MLFSNKLGSPFVKLHNWLEFPNNLRDFINFGWWVTMVGSWMAIHVKLGDHPRKNRGWGRWVTILDKVGDQPLKCGYHPWDS